MKRLLALLLCLCMALLCTGCAGISQPVDTENATQDPAADLDAAAVSGTEAPDISDEAEEIVVDQLVEVDDLMINDSISDGEWMNILLLGGDSRGKNDYGRTDAIVILSVNKQTAAVKMTSIMRDTWVNIYGKGEQKINSANVYGGPELAMRTVNECFDMNISKYVLVNMQALAEIIDALGGIEVPEVTEAQRKALNQQMTYDAEDFVLADDTPLEESGTNVRLTGNQALAFARIRNLDSDYARVDRQRVVLVAMAKELQQMGATTAIGLIPTLLEHVETNLNMSEMVELAGVGLQLDLNNIEQQRLPAEGTYESGKIEGTWKIVADLEENAQILSDFIYGDADEATPADVETAE